MAGAGGKARLLNLDAFVPRAVELELNGQVHRVPGAALTAELVLGIQVLAAKAEEEDPSAVQDLTDILDKILSAASPPLQVDDLPVAAIGPVALFLMQQASGGEEEADPPPPSRSRSSRPAAGRTTARSRTASGRKR